MFTIDSISLYAKEPTRVFSKDQVVSDLVSDIHHQANGMRIFFIPKAVYLSLSLDQQASFTDDVQEAYDNVVRQYFPYSSDELFDHPELIEYRAGSLKERNDAIKKEVAEGTLL